MYSIIKYPLLSVQVQGVDDNFIVFCRDVHVKTEKRMIGRTAGIQINILHEHCQYQCGKFDLFVCHSQ